MASEKMATVHRSEVVCYIEVYVTSSCLLHRVVCDCIIQASGGSGEYVWSTANSQISKVNIKGEALTVGPGSTNITAADAKNTAHTGTVTVSSLHCLHPAPV